MRHAIDFEVSADLGIGVERTHDVAFDEWAISFEDAGLLLNICGTGDELVALLTAALNELQSARMAPAMPRRAA